MRNVLVAIKVMAVFGMLIAGLMCYTEVKKERRWLNYDDPRIQRLRKEGTPLEKKQTPLEEYFEVEEGPPNTMLYRERIDSYKAYIIPLAIFGFSFSLLFLKGKKDEVKTEIPEKREQNEQKNERDA